MPRYDAVLHLRPAILYPFRRCQDIAVRGSECRRDQASGSDFATAPQPGQAGTSFGNHSQQRLRFTAKLIFAARHFSKLLQHSPPEFPPGKSQVVCYVRHCKLECNRQFSVRRAVFCIGEIIAFKQSKLRHLPCCTAMCFHPFDCKSKQGSHPLLFKITFRRFHVRSRGQFVLCFIKIKRHMQCRTATLLPARVTQLVHKQPVNTCAQKGTQTALLRIVRAKKFLFQKAEEKILRKVLRILALQSPAHPHVFVHRTPISSSDGFNCLYALLRIMALRGGNHRVPRYWKRIALLLWGHRSSIEGAAASLVASAACDKQELPTIFRPDSPRFILLLFFGA